ncbi:hypothetical protein G0U57_018232, partial [Chelydra serpentina]
VTLPGTQNGTDGGVLIPEDFVPPAAHSDSGHIAPLLSTRKADRWARSRPQIQVHPKSHHQVNPVTDMGMALRGLHLAILLPHILLAGSLGQFGETDSYKKFMNQHFDYPKTSDTENKTYCNYMMSKRGMTYDSCKHINTFIHAPESDIKAICHSKGIRDTGNIYNSTENFRLTTCQLNTTNSSESCTYMEIEETSKIRVACDNRQLPVHFENRMQAAHMPLNKIQTQLGHTSSGLPRLHRERKQGAALKPQVGTES